jgi:hypothetical protein
MNYRAFAGFEWKQLPLVARSLQICRGMELAVFRRASTTGSHGISYREINTIEHSSIHSYR